MKLPVLVTVAGAVAALSACAPVDDLHTSADAAARCFTGADVDNFRVDGDRRIYIHSRRGDVYRLDAAAPNCFSGSTATIAVEPWGGSSPNICPGDQARVRATDRSAIPLTCVARVSGPITDSSVSGLPG
ncbi:MAG: hypothetical protein ACK4JY_06700 [Brevundimonas sp.]|uniref:hypothetical protein n=1 Tax=Brevundimonas sp. TaxID=1871086 RepID=UPI00391DFBC3